MVALNGAMLVNCAILVLAAAVFFKRGIVVTEIQQAHQLLVPLLGASLAGVMFAVALLCSGQSSTLTGTMAGQIVMEGFLNIRMRPWLRRLITRSLAIMPAALTIYFAGDKATLGLLMLSQVILSMQLPFAVIPLIHFTSDRARMGSFANAAVGALAGLDHGRRGNRPEHVAGLRFDCGLAGRRRGLAAAGRGGRHLGLGRAGATAAVGDDGAARSAAAASAGAPRSNLPDTEAPRPPPSLRCTTASWCRWTTPLWTGWR